MLFTQKVYKLYTSCIDLMHSCIKICISTSYISSIFIRNSVQEAVIIGVSTFVVAGGYSHVCFVRK